MYGLRGDNYYITFMGDLVNLQKLTDAEETYEFIECIDRQKESEVFISTDDVPLFAKTMLPMLAKNFQCERNNFDAGAETEVTFKIYLDAPQKHMISCRLAAVYGDDEYDVYDENYGNVSVKDIDKLMADGRDCYKEMNTGGKVAAYFNAYDEVSHSMVINDDENLMYELMTDGIGEFEALGEVYITDALKRINIIAPSKVAVGVSVSENMLNLTLTSGDMTRAQLAEILSRYDRKKKYYRLKNGDFVKLSEGQFDAICQIKESIALTEKQLGQEIISIPKYRALYIDGKLEDSNIEADISSGFRELIRNMKTAKDNSFAVPATLDGVLRGYQRTGFMWLKTLKNNGFGGILADDMGLGKTLQVICFLLSEKEGEAQNSEKASGVGKTLIVSPASLVYNWKSEIERFAPKLLAVMVIGSASERKEIIESASDDSILLTSYDLLKRDVDYYKGIHFANEIIDEAQYIKNQNTQAARAVKEIEADFKAALTGTPVENSLSELHSIFDFIMPGFLYSYQRFRKELELPIVQNRNEEALLRLQKMIAPFILRRLKRDVLRDIPDKNEENVFARIEGEQQELYDAHVKRMKLVLDKTSNEDFDKSKLQILAELTKLRQLCCDPALVMNGYKKESAKLELCMEMIANAIAGGHKILLFSQFTSMLEIIEKRLKKENISFYSLTGATPKEKRAKLVEGFQSDDTSVFCISLKAGGTGLNLTAADIVIHYDPWWNVAAQNQATDRAHRIGQENPVTVYRLIAKGTIEENILKLQERKRELADQVMAGDSVGSGSFNREELLELLG